MHTVNLNSLDGKENLPEKKTLNGVGMQLTSFKYYEGCNDTIDHLNQCTVGLDEVAIYNLLKERIDCEREKPELIFWPNPMPSSGVEKMYEWDKQLRRLAKLIASKPELVIKIGKSK